MFRPSSLSVLIARVRASTTLVIIVCALASTLSMSVVSAVCARAPRWTPEQRATDVLGRTQRQLGKLCTGGGLAHG